MPRDRPPDARCLAHAAASILPFLAPRAFVASPFRRAASGWTSGLSGHMQEEEVKEKNSWWSGTERGRSAVWDGCRRDGASFSAVHPGVCLRRPSAPNSTRYADIFVFAQRQMSNRAHAPESPPRKLVQALKSRRQGKDVTKAIPNSPVKSIPKDRRKTILRNVVSKKDIRERIEGNSGGSRTSITAKISGLAEHRRKTALHHTLLRWRRFIQRNGSKIPPQFRYFDGRYRSLARRLFNFSRTKPGFLYTGMDGVNITPNDILMQGLAALDRRVYPGVRRSSHFLELAHDVRVPGWEGLLFPEGGPRNDSKGLKKRWLEFPYASRTQNWSRILLFLMDKNPLRALRFLQVLGQTLPPRHIALLPDAFEHLVRRFQSDAASERDIGLVPVFWQTIGPLLDRYPYLCSQDLLMNLVHFAEADDAESILDRLLEKGAFISYHTLLHYANVFGEVGKHQHALRCLQRIPDKMRNLSSEKTVRSERFSWSCALILRRSLKDPESYHMTSGIVADFMRLGVKLDLPLHNVIMRNAMEAGDHETAFKIYHLLEVEGLKPDKYTYSIMLRGCTTTDNPTVFCDFAETCRKMALELQDARLAVDYLFYVVRCSSQSGDPTYYEREVSEAYSKVFQPGPMAPFWGQRESVEEGLLEPLPAALSLVLSAQIRKAAAISNKNVWDLYQHFLHLVRMRKHLLLNKVAKETYIWNSFLMAFCNSQQFANASHLIQTMSDATQSIPFEIAKPDIISWTIFMAAFVKADQFEAAERVFEIMRARGVEPDQVTWSTLVRGYARTQNVKKVGDILPFLDSETQVEPRLLASLAQMQDRGDLMHRFEQIRIQKEREEAQKEDARAREHEQRWAASGLDLQTPVIEEHAEFDILASGSQEVAQHEPVTKKSFARLPANGPYFWHPGLPSEIRKHPIGKSVKQPETKSAAEEQATEEIPDGTDAQEQHERSLGDASVLQLNDATRPSNVRVRYHFAIPQNRNDPQPASQATRRVMASSSLAKEMEPGTQPSVPSPTVIKDDIASPTENNRDPIQADSWSPSRSSELPKKVRGQLNRNRLRAYKW